MRQETIHYFTEKEDELASLLIQIGTKKNIAKALVFLAGKSESSTTEIEHGADMRQPEVSLAMKYLIQCGWVTSHDGPSSNKGRPVKVYRLTRPITEILLEIEKGKSDEITNRFECLKKLDTFIR